MQETNNLEYETSIWEDEAWHDDDWQDSRPTPWYRKSAKWLLGIFIVCLFASGALMPWGRWIDELDNVSNSEGIKIFAEQTAAESPYSWLVSDIKVQFVLAEHIGGYVHSHPADGIIYIDHRSWEQNDLISVVHHEIGHLIDFAVWGHSSENHTEYGEVRGGLASEVWAECAAVHAGFRELDSSSQKNGYFCRSQDLETYSEVIANLGEFCAPWNNKCGQVQWQRADPLVTGDFQDLKD